MARVVLLLSSAGAAASPMCCWSKWGDSSSCGNYDGSGGQCNTDHSKSCSSSSDCPVTPAPAPTPPPTPAPAPPAPAPAPSNHTFVPMPHRMLGMYVLIADDTDK